MHDLTEAIRTELVRQGGYSEDGNTLVSMDWQEGSAVNLPALVAAVQAELVRASTVTTEAELNALPEETIIRAEVHRERPGGRRPQVIARIYEKYDMRRNEWLHLDPGDRTDGEETEPASLIVNYYGTNGCRVLFRPV